jgi:hypothetical protein
MKRVFTKIFEDYVSASGVPPVKNDAALSWLLQEDIEVIAAVINIQCVTPSENDGFSNCVVELSQVGLFAQNGTILSGRAGEGWNTTPAGILQTNCNIAMVFEAGMAVPVREEGYLHINTEAGGKSAGISIFYYTVTVYYTKKGSR